MQKPSSGKLYKRLLSYVKPYWPIFVIAALGNVGYAGVDSFSMWLFKPLLDKGFIGKDYHFLSIFPLIILGLFVLRGISSFLANYSIGYIGRKIVLNFRLAMFDKLLLLPAKFFDGTTSGKLLAKLTYNVEQVTEATSSSLTILIREGCFVIGLLTVMFITSWRFTLFILIVLPIVAWIVSIVSKRFRKLSRRIQEAMGDITHIAEETITGYREVRIYAGSEKQKSLFHKVATYNYVQEMKIIITNAVSTPIIQLLGAIVLALIVYFAIGRGHEAMSAGSFVTMISAMLAILKPIKNLSTVNSSIQKGLAAAESIFELLDQPAETDTGTKTIKDAKGKLELKNVSFSYGELTAINKLNLTITPGKSVALVGPSGGGKSTLVSLLTRFYLPTSGEILFDDTDIQQLTLKNLRQNFALVSQNVTLFDDSVFNNIAYGLERKVSEAEVIKAAKAAHAWGFIQQLEQGLQTRVGENGLNLSGGQRQRVAIARALLKDAPVLIMDEATSALDNESEREIQAALETLKKDRTTIVIAHRLSTIENADQIIVLDRGEIVETGTHQELVKLQGLYAALQAK